MKKRILVWVALLSVPAASAQTVAQIELWPQGMPDSNGLTGEETKVGTNGIGNVSVPALYLFRAAPDKNTGAVVLICPGGGYEYLAMDYEGTDIARWLAAEGITAAVLKYRMPNGHPEIPLHDAAQAVRLLRKQAPEWNIDPHRIGIAGSSAGGHLAATLAARHTADSRPDFAVLFYPVISFSPEIGHKGSVLALTGGSDPALLRYYSCEKQVTSTTPPVLMFHGDDDSVVSVMNSMVFYKQLKAHGIPAALYVFPKAEHGWGFKPEFGYHTLWKDLLLKWLEDMNFIPPPTGRRTAAVFPQK